jgi:hypothetical protein
MRDAQQIFEERRLENLEETGSRRGRQSQKTKRVRDILTPQGATPHPHRSLAALSQTHRLPSPHAGGSGHHTPNIPHVHNVSRNNGKIKLRLEFSPAQTMAKKSSRLSLPANIARTARDGVGDSDGSASMA